jgi:hypothetical protein
MEADYRFCLKAVTLHNKLYNEGRALHKLAETYRCADREE